MANGNCFIVLPNSHHLIGGQIPNTSLLTIKQLMPNYQVSIYLLISRGDKEFRTVLKVMQVRMFRYIICLPLSNQSTISELLRPGELLAQRLHFH